jgi:hypothetical protein
MNRGLLVFLIISSSSTLLAQAPYYQGKTLRLIVSSTAGSRTSHTLVLPWKKLLGK